MKKIPFVLLILVLSFSGVFAQTSKKPKSLKPENYQNKLKHVISGNTRSYYLLSTDRFSTINVRGPGKLRVITRGRFVSENDADIDYEILYSVNGAELKKVEENSVGRSKKAKYQNSSLGVPGELKDFEIKLGRGYHTIQFKLNDDDIPVANRYLFTSTKPKKKNWISYSPKQPSEPVNLISREDITHYYRFSMEEPLSIEVNGPTELRVLTRIENHYHMKGRIQYRVQVTEKNEVINTYQLSSSRSQVTVYESDDKLVPGKAREFVINVPSGRHRYEINPLDRSHFHLVP